MNLEQPWDQKRMFWWFEKSIFQIFGNFLVTKVKPFFGKVMQSVQDYLNQNLVIGSFLENDARATLTSKKNVPSIWTKHFSVFCEFLSDKIEAVLWEI